MTSILDAPMQCPLCGWTGRVGDTEPDVDSDGSLGCPIEECGGIVTHIAGCYLAQECHFHRQAGL